MLVRCVVAMLLCMSNVQRRSASDGAIARPTWHVVIPLVWSESRPVVQVLFGTRFVVAALLAGGVGSIAWLPALLGWTLLTVAVYVSNGLSDLEGDRRNGSTRPLASGRLASRHAAAAVALAAGMGLAVLALFGPMALLLGAAFLAAGLLYSHGPHPLKNHWPSAGCCCAAGGLLTFAAGVVAAGGSLTPGRAVLLVAAGLWMGIGGATKDLGDAEGDAHAGRRTLPVVLGARSARRAIVGAAVLFAVATTGAALATGSPGLTAVSIVAAAVVVARSLRDGQDDPRLPYRRFIVGQFVTLTCLATAA